MQIHPPPDADDADAAPTRPPVRVEVATEAVRDVTLVRVKLRSDVDAPLRVRIGNRLDGPVLPPRTEGVPATGWDDEGFSGTLRANGTLGVGYACPGSVARGGDAGADAGTRDTAGTDADAAVAVELRGTPDGSSGAAPGDDPSGDVAAAVRDLGRAVPPADAVPARSPTPTRSVPADADGSRDRRVPDPVSGWLDAVAARVERAERLTDASAADAAAVLEDCGGPDGIDGLTAALATDAAALRATAARVEELRSRSAAADPEPVVDALLDGAAALSDAPDAAAAEVDR